MRSHALRTTSVPFTGLAALLLTLVIACAPAEEPTPTPPPAMEPGMTPDSPVATPDPTPADVPAETPDANGAEPQTGGTIETAHRRTPITFDLHDNTSIDQVSHGVPINNSLVSLAHPEYTELIPELAEDWEFSDDGMTLTFHLKEGVVDHDGNPFTSEDAKWSLERMADPGSFVSPFFEGRWDSIDTPDEYTVVLNLPHPQAAILNQMNPHYATMYTSEPWEVDGKDPETEPVGVGPWRMVEHVPGEVVRYERHEDYHKDGLPYADELVIHTIRDPAPRRSAFESQRLDLILLGSSHGIYEPHWEEIEERHQGEMTWGTGIHHVARGVAFNLESEGPWQDARVRQAINLAISRQDALDAIPLSFIDGAYLAPTDAWGYTTDEFAEMPGFRADKAQDIEEAQRLMTEAGFEDGFEVDVMCRDTSEYRELHCPFVDFELRSKLGIEANLQVEESAVWTERRRALDYDIEYGSTAGARIDDPDDYLADLTCDAPANYYGWCNEEFDSLYDQQSQTMDDQERDQLVRQMQDILLEELPFAEVWWAARSWGYWHHVQSPPVEESSGQYTAARRLEHTWLDE